MFEIEENFCLLVERDWLPTSFYKELQKAKVGLCVEKVKFNNNYEEHI